MEEEPYQVYFSRASRGCRFDEGPILVLKLGYQVFHRKDGTILYTLDQESFIEAFGLTRVMGQPIDLKDLQRRFEANPNAFTRASLM